MRFGTPFAKVLLVGLPPVLLAGLLHLGSGVGLTLLRSVRLLRGPKSVALAVRRPLACAAVLVGGVLGPVLLMADLRSTPERRPRPFS